MINILKVVKKTIKEYQLIAPGDLVIAGVSGGPDSLALLHILKGLQDEFCFKLHVGHVDHSFRGQEAEAEARWVKETVEKWGIPCTVHKENVPKIAREKGLSAEEAGHIVRKKFFLGLMASLGAQKVALGHHADDQAETVLMHFLVGAGMEGLQGMKPLNTPFIRPLILLRRQDIEFYCREQVLKPRFDPSNQSEIYLRNRIRQQVIPWLAQKINPNLVETLNRTAHIIQKDEEILQRATEKLAAQHMQMKKDVLSVSLKDWDNLYEGLQRRLIRYAYTKVGEKQGLVFLHVERVQNLIKEGQVGKVLQLPGKIIAEKGYSELFFYEAQNVSPLVMQIAARTLKIPGVTKIPETGQSIMAEFVDDAETIEPGDKSKICLPWAESSPQYLVRSRKPGDRISPLGLQGTKKLKDFFIEKKIPRRDRDRLLLVVAGEEIVWIPGLTLTEKSRKSSKHDHYLVLKLLNPS